MIQKVCIGSGGDALNAILAKPIVAHLHTTYHWTSTPYAGSMNQSITLEHGYMHRQVKSVRAINVYWKSGRPIENSDKMAQVIICAYVINLKPSTLYMNIE